MPLTETQRDGLRNALGIVRVAAGIALMVALSWEIIEGDHVHFSSTYLRIQFIVCAIFLVDFFVRWAAATSRHRFLLHNILYLLISIPYLNIILWWGIQVPHDWMLMIGMVPLARGFLAFYFVVRWVIGNTVSRLLAAYILTVVVFTYLSALVFYDYEIQVNPHLDGFGNALWWAWMNVTTVGAQIFAVTPVGKVITILLPTLGMMMFPIFTTFIIERYTRHRGSKKPDA